MGASDKLIESMKDMARESGKEYTDDEAREAADNLTGFFELLWEGATRDAQKKKRLRKEPDGFLVDGQYSCTVCGNTINPETGWYDKYGQKCQLCQKAVKDGVIPTYVCINRDSYFPMYTLTSDLKVRSVTIQKFVRQGKLKARIILNNEGKPYHYIFLKKENPNLILQNNPIRKSYDRNRDKKHKIWAKKTAREWMDDINKKTKKK